MSIVNTVTAADAAVADQPRARSRRISGAKDAATTSDRRIETVTVPSTTAAQIVTAARATMTRRRQLTAPVRRSQTGTTGSAGAIAVKTFLRSPVEGRAASLWSPVSTAGLRDQDRPGFYLPAARASACSLIVANSAGVMAPDVASSLAFSISSAGENALEARRSPPSDRRKVHVGDGGSRDEVDQDAEERQHHDQKDPAGLCLHPKGRACERCRRRRR